MKKFIHIFLLFVCLIVACKKEKPACTEPIPAPPSTQWQKYIGVYDVYDTANNRQWIMEIKFLSSSGRVDGQNDSILLLNFANKFNIRYMFRYSTDPNRIGLPFIFGLKDIQGNSWSFTSSGEDSNTTYLENYLRNDSIILYFKQSNIAFYQNDGVPYYECDCKHIAVKRR